MSWGVKVKVGNMYRVREQIESVCKSKAHIYRFRE